MSGLVTQTRQKGRGSGLSQGWTFRRFTDTSGSVTIAKPYGCTMLIIECIGGGGGGGGGQNAGGAGGEGGGGGGGGGGGAEGPPPHIIYSSVSLLFRYRTTLICPIR